MNRLQKFIEKGAYGEGKGRIAYVFTVDKLPAPTYGMRWNVVQGFSSTEELLSDAGLRAVFKVAVERGIAVVTPA